MTTQEQRFHAAVAAMQGLLASPDSFTSEAPSRAVRLADSLLAELDRAATVKELLTVQPDADGWIPHRPGDPMPCDPETLIWVKLRDPSFVDRSPETAGYWDEEDDHASNWRNADSINSIIAWKPADK
jgi:hypothetical protein